MRDILLGSLGSQATAEEEARGFPGDVDVMIAHLVIGSTEMKRARVMISPFLRSGKSCGYSCGGEDTWTTLILRTGHMDDSHRRRRMEDSHVEERTHGGLSPPPLCRSVLPLDFP